MARSVIRVVVLDAARANADHSDTSRSIVPPEQVAQQTESALKSELSAALQLFYVDLLLRDAC